MRKTATTDTIGVAELRIERVLLDIEGDTPLIVHNWSVKAKQMMLDKQMGKAVPKKQPKDPEEDYQSSRYRMPDGSDGFPGSGFKAAIVGAGRMFENLPMTKLKIAIRVNGEFVKINGEPHSREDMVRLETGVADIRYRACFDTWGATLDITYNAGSVSLEQLVNLVNAAGFGGVGEWRPSAPKSASGSYGTFHVVSHRPYK